MSSISVKWSRSCPRLCRRFQRAAQIRWYPFFSFGNFTHGCFLLLYFAILILHTFIVSLNFQPLAGELLAMNLSAAIVLLVRSETGIYLFIHFSLIVQDAHEQQFPFVVTHQGGIIREVNSTTGNEEEVIDLYSRLMHVYQNLRSSDHLGVTEMLGLQLSKAQFPCLCRDKQNMQIDIRAGNGAVSRPRQPTRAALRQSHDMPVHTHLTRPPI